jgi:hypothetical protein
MFAGRAFALKGKSMAKSKSEILNDFQEFIGKHGSKYKEWCVGTAEDPKTQLFNVHKFKTGDKGLYREAESEIQAAGVAEFFTNLGAKGDDSVKRGADCVYAYKMAAHTKP